MSRERRHSAAPIALALLALVPLSGCFRDAPSTASAPPGPPAGMPGLPPDPRAGRTAPTTRNAPLSDVGGAALPSKPVDGSALNKFFPKGVTFTQEKKGYSMANIQGGTLSITDLAGNPSGRDKYRASTTQLDGYPMVAVGNQGIAILVGDRYQVQVRSVAPGREDWLKKVNLSGLAGLK